MLHEFATNKLEAENESLWDGLSLALYPTATGQTGQTLFGIDPFRCSATLSSMSWDTLNAGTVLVSAGGSAIATTNYQTNWSGKDITLSFWLKIASGPLGRFVAKNDNSQFSFGLYDSFNFFWGGNGGFQSFVMPSNVNTSLMQAYSITLTGAARSLYVSGVLGFSNVSYGAIASAVAPLVFANRVGSDRPAACSIDAISVHERILSDDEIKLLATSRTALLTPKQRRLFKAWPMVGVSGVTDYSLTPSSITTGAPAVGSTTLAQVHSLTPSGLATAAPIVGSTTITQVHSISPNGITTGQPVVGSTTLTQVHSLSPNSIATGSPAIGQPSLSQVHALSPGSIATGNPVIGQMTVSSGTVYSLSPNLIVAGSPAVGSTTISQVHSLVASSIATGQPSVGTTSLLQVHSLVAMSILAGTPTISSVTLTSGDGSTSTATNVQIVGYRQSLVVHRNTLKAW